MRRPLTANGVPVIQTSVAPNTPATIFNLNDNDVDADAVLLVTLFCYIPLDTGSDNKVNVNVVTDGASVTIGTWDDTAIAAAFENTFTRYRDNGIGAAKLLDRVPMRGNQQLIVESLLEDSALWYGYYERVGVAPIPVTARPLQPGNLVSPYNAPFVSITSPADESTQTVTVHALDNREEKLDFLTLYAYCESSAVPLGTPLCALITPGGIPIEIPIVTAPGIAPGGGGQPVKIYEGIPVRAPSSTDNLFQIQVKGDTTAILTTVVYGSFSRA